MTLFDQQAVEAGARALRDDEEGEGAFDRLPPHQKLQDTCRVEDSIEAALSSLKSRGVDIEAAVAEWQARQMTHTQENEYVWELTKKFITAKANIYCCINPDASDEPKDLLKRAYQLLEEILPTILAELTFAREVREMMPKLLSAVESAAHWTPTDYHKKFYDDILNRLRNLAGPKAPAGGK